MLMAPLFPEITIPVSIKVIVLQFDIRNRLSSSWWCLYVSQRWASVSSKSIVLHPSAFNEDFQRRTSSFVVP